MRTALPLHSHTPRRSTRRPAAILAGVVVLITAAMIPVYRLQELSWPEAIAASIVFVIPCALLGWGAWRLLTRRPQTHDPTLAIATHVIGAIAFSIVWTIPLTALVYLIRRDGAGAFLSGGAVWQLVWGVVIYCVLLLAARAQQRLKEQQLAAADAELHALRAQLDPHFLFNTLHSLTQLAREDPIATQDALQRFGEMMRYVLSSGRVSGADVSLEEEIGFVRDYLALERLRLGDRLRVVERFEPDTLELAVPPLLLQPLVENAVRHGVSQRREGAVVQLSAAIEHDRLMFSVSDDGNGVDAASMRQSKGLGLKAVARQLRAHFGDEAEMTIETSPRAGFTVELRMQMRLPRRVPPNAHDFRRR